MNSMRKGMRKMWKHMWQETRPSSAKEKDYLKKFQKSTVNSSETIKIKKDAETIQRFASNWNQYSIKSITKKVIKITSTRIRLYANIVLLNKRKNITISRRLWLRERPSTIAHLYPNECGSVQQIVAIVKVLNPCTVCNQKLTVCEREIVCVC